MTVSVSANAGNRAPDRTSPAQWLAVGVLALSTFLVVTSEMLPIGLLTPMSRELGISPGAAGLSLTITGLVSAVTAPIVPRVLGDLDRRIVLAVAMVALTAGNVSTMLASGFGTLVMSRTVLGIGMGVVWGLAAAVAARLVAPRDIALSVSFAVGGVAAASVLGVPVGTVIGSGFGWRAAFAVLAVVGLIAGVGLLLVLPRLPRPETPSATTGSGKPRPLMRPTVVTGLAVVILLVTAHFAAYTYIRLILEGPARLSAGSIALLLMLYGVFGLVGNFAAGALAARRPKATSALLAGGITAAVTALTLYGTAGLAAGVVVALWGLAYGGLSVGAQLWMTAAAPDRVEHVTGLYVGVFNAAIALGAFVGGRIVESAGTLPLLRSAAGLAAVALLVALFGSGPAVRIDEAHH